MTKNRIKDNSSPVVAPPDPKLVELAYTKQDLQLILNLCEIAWRTGSIKDPKVGDVVNALREKTARIVTRIK